MNIASFWNANHSISVKKNLTKNSSRVGVKMNGSFMCNRLFILLVSIVLGGCATTSVKDSEYTIARNTSDVKGIATKYLDDKGNAKYNRSNLHETLEAAKAYHDSGLWQLSNEAFSVAQSKLAWKEDTVDTPEEVARFLGTTLTNNTFGSYSGKIHEGSLLNFYRALNFLMLIGAEGDTEKKKTLEQQARVEFNRLEERQKNAIAQLQSYIRTSNNSESSSREKGDTKQFTETKDAMNLNLQNGLNSVPAQTTLADIRNATGDFLAAVFRSTSSFEQDKDVQRINALISNAAGSAADGQSASILAKFTRDVETGSGRIKDKIFIVYEDGTGPSLSEIRVDLPIFLVSNKITYSGIALPKFNNGTKSHGTLIVGSQSTAVMTDINRIVGLEFKSSYDALVAKEVASAIVKTTAQYALNNEIDRKNNSPVGSLLLKLATGAAQAALTKADTRHWRNLPNTLQVAIIDRPPTGQILIQTNSGQTLQALDIDRGNHILLIKSSGSSGTPDVRISKLGLDQ
jgi:hypothetical protein